jgi:precorrin-8X/cobalt-precorrin-8 methylmutase
MIDWNLPPGAIERLSFEIIDAEAPPHDWPADAWSVIRRMIHTTADFDYITSVRMHPQAMAGGVRAIAGGCTIFTDTNMAAAGMPARRLRPYGVEVRCLMGDQAVAAAAAQGRTTRAYAAVDAVLESLGGNIYVVGNAPTALFRLVEHITAGRVQPALVVGLPVGFVNAAESKAALAQTDCPYITALGRKGGSAVAASVINALAELCAGGEKHD